MRNAIARVRLKPDATCIQPDATWMLPDATCLQPDATCTLPDSTSKLPDSTRLLPDSTRLLPDSTRKLPDSTRRLPVSTRALAGSTRARCAAAAVALVAAAWPAWAHHSHGNYNMTAYTNLKGVVTEVHWLNPHTWVYLEVKDAKGEATIWALEGASVVQLERRGWTKDMLKAGSTISVRCHQLRDGSSGCLLGFITPEGGVEKIFD